MQITSVFLHPAVFFLPRHGLKGSSAHTLLGLVLIASFTVFRILPIPFVIYAVVSGRQALLLLPSHIVAIVVLSFPIPPMLNIYW